MKATVPWREPGLNRQPFSSFPAPALDDIAAVPGLHFLTETMRPKALDIGLTGQILFHKVWIITHTSLQSRNKKKTKKLLQSAGCIGIITPSNSQNSILWINCL